jgi:peroxiredoxin
MSRSIHPKGHEAPSSNRFALLVGGGAVALILVVLAALLISPPASEESQSSAPAPAAGSGEAQIAVQSSLLGENPGQPLQVGDVAPDFSYTLADGTTRSLSELRGKKVLLNFWATWCPPCRAEMPDIQQAARQYEGEGFVVLAVNSGEDVQAVQGFASEMNLTIPLITDPSNEIGSAYSARNLPVSYFINSDGTISFRQIGLMNLSFIERRIEQMQ